MRIAGIQKLSTIDYPEILSAVVFTNGCNYNCWYCHNKELIDGKSADISNDDVIDYLANRKNLLQGVVITGGEPTIQKGLIAFIQKVKSLGYKVKLDTNGSQPYILNDLLTYLDYVAIDYKSVKDMYESICGKVDCSAVIQSLQLLGNSHISWEVRTTVVPELELLISDIKSELDDLKLNNKPTMHRLNPYRVNPIK